MWFSRRPVNCVHLEARCVANVRDESQIASRFENGDKPATDGWFSVCLAAGYFLFELALILHHAMWRDEMQVWMLARHSVSIRNLIYLKRYEGHPDGWYLLVYVLTRMTANPIAMQLLNLAIATTTAYVIARYAPFTRLQKTLLVCGYFFIFEYASISRGYALGVLCVVCFCAVFHSGIKTKWLPLAILLGAMMQTSIYGVMIALALGFAVYLEFGRSPEGRRWLGLRFGSATLAAAILLSSLFLSLLHALPVRGSMFAIGLHFSLRPRAIEQTLSMTWNSFVPVPQLSRQFWNTNLLPLWLSAALSLPILFISDLFFLRKPSLLRGYISGFTALLLFKHAEYRGFLRHDGHGFILFIACCWLAPYFRTEPFPTPRLDALAGWFQARRNRVFRGLLVIQAAVGLACSAAALQLPFSQARSAARFVSSQGMAKLFIVGDADPNVSTIAGYLDREIYYRQKNAMGSFIVWEHNKPPRETAFQIAGEEALRLHQNVLVILNYRPQRIDNSAHEIASFEGAIVPDEDFYVYLVPYVSPP